MGMLLIVGGVVLLSLSLGADLIGIGSHPGMHWKQWGGTIEGPAFALVGFWLARGKSENKS